MSAEILREAAEAIRFDASDADGPWANLPDAVALAVADWLDYEAHPANGRDQRMALAVARAYLGRGA